MRPRTITKRVAAMATFTALLAAGALSVGTSHAQDNADPPPPTPSGIGQLTVVRFDASPRTVRAGGTTKLTWDIDGPTDVRIELDGIQVQQDGSTWIKPTKRDEKHALVARSGSLTRELGLVVVGVDPCPLNSTQPQDPVQCDHAPAIAADYEVPGSRYIYSPEVKADDGVPDVQPESQLVVLDACKTDPGSAGRIEQYDWSLTRADLWNARPITASSQWCRTSVRVPTRGYYRVALTARSAHSTTIALNATFNVRDQLIVSLGDSMASGEGNPDSPGNYLPPPAVAEAYWKDQGCHRSEVASPTMAAQRLNQSDLHSSMTFISLACSGATTTDLYSHSQTDFAGKTHPPQLRALRDLLCHWDCNRSIDALMLSIGINNLHFADMLKACFLDANDDDGCARAITDAENTLPYLQLGFDNIRNGLLVNGLNVRHVILTEYPVNILNDANGEPRSGCGALQLTQTTSARLFRLGQRLNDFLRNYAATHDGWSYAGGVVNAFTGHGYCESDSTSYFRDLGGSLDTQGDQYGTAHPNGNGHRQIGRLLADRYRAAEAVSSIHPGEIYIDGNTPKAP